MPCNTWPNAGSCSDRMVHYFVIWETSKDVKEKHSLQFCNCSDALLDFHSSERLPCSGSRLCSSLEHNHDKRDLNWALPLSRQAVTTGHACRQPVRSEPLRLTSPPPSTSTWHFMKDGRWGSRVTQTWDSAWRRMHAQHHPTPRVNTHERTYHTWSLSLAYSAHCTCCVTWMFLQDLRLLYSCVSLQPCYTETK